MVLSEKETQEKLKQERLLSTVSQTLERTIAARLDKTVREEIYNRVMPGNRQGHISILRPSFQV